MNQEEHPFRVAEITLIPSTPADMERALQPCASALAPLLTVVGAWDCHPWWVQLCTLSANQISQHRTCQLKKKNCRWLCVVDLTIQ